MSVSHAIFSEDLLFRLSDVKFQANLRELIVDCETDRHSLRNILERERTQAMRRWDEAAAESNLKERPFIRMDFCCAVPNPEFMSISRGLDEAYGEYAWSKGLPYLPNASITALYCLANGKDKKHFAAALRLMLLQETERMLAEDRIVQALEMLRQEIKKLDGKLESIKNLPAWPVPKPRSRHPKSSSHLKGSKTEFMNRQLNEFVAFMANRKYDDHGRERSVYAVAFDFWNRNKKKFDKAAKATGKARGYKKYTVLANAYNNLLASRPPMAAIRSGFKNAIMPFP